MNEKAKDLIDNHEWEVIVHYMDDDIRENLALELSPCNNEEFLEKYLELHEEKYGEEFIIN